LEARSRDKLHNGLQALVVIVSYPHIHSYLALFFSPMNFLVYQKVANCHLKMPNKLNFAFRRNLAVRHLVQQFSGFLALVFEFGNNTQF